MREWSMESGSRCGVARSSQGTRIFTALLAAFVLSCGGGDEAPAADEESEGRGSEIRDRGDIEIHWTKAPDPISKALSDGLREEEAFEALAEGLNESLKLPRDLQVTHESCDEENAFYDPTRGTLTMCYELLTSIAQAATTTAESDDEASERIAGTWLFVFFHELGHALIDLYDLPSTGRQEDAVDEFSTVLLVESGNADLALRAAEYWATLDTGELTTLSFADEHSLTQQRFYSILCLVYGSDPETYANLVSQGDDGLLPESRAVRCEDEYRDKRDAWQTLLEPWTK
jgi:hypothetical protein